MVGSQQGETEQARKACVLCGNEFPGNLELCPSDGTLLTPIGKEPRIGDIIADRYEIMGILGDGGMGKVYKARHNLMKRVVAIKMLLPHLVQSGPALKRFQQEAQAASALKHPHIMTVHDFGISDKGMPFLVMDYLEGISLSTLLSEIGTVPQDRAVNIFIQACSALQHAHKNGVVHRDLKPANLMLIDFDGQPDFLMVVDFGIAKLLQPDAAVEQLTHTGEVFGSPLYMSPEQCRGKELDPRSDIYSLGCVIYRAITGRPVFGGRDAMECMFKQVNDLPGSFSEVCPELHLSQKLEDAVFKAIAKDPEARYQDMGKFREALELVKGPAQPVSRVFSVPPQSGQEVAYDARTDRLGHLGLPHDRAAGQSGVTPAAVPGTQGSHAGQGGQSQPGVPSGTGNYQALPPTASSPGSITLSANSAPVQQGPPAQNNQGQQGYNNQGAAGPGGAPPQHNQSAAYPQYDQQGRQLPNSAMQQQNSQAANQQYSQQQPGGVGANPQPGPSGANPQYGPSGGNPPYGQTGANPQYGPGGGNPPYGQTGANPQYGQGGANPPYSQTGANPQYGQGGANPPYGQTGANPQYGPGGANPQYGQNEQQMPQGQSGPYPQNGQNANAAGNPNAPYGQTGANPQYGQPGANSQQGGNPNVQYGQTGANPQYGNNPQYGPAAVNPQNGQTGANAQYGQNDQNLQYGQGVPYQQQGAPQGQYGQPQYGQNDPNLQYGQGGPYQQQGTQPGQYGQSQYGHVDNSGQNTQYGQAAMHGQQAQGTQAVQQGAEDSGVRRSASRRSAVDGSDDGASSDRISRGDGAKKGANNQPLIIGGAIGLLLLIGGVALVSMSGGHHDKTSPSNSSQSSNSSSSPSNSSSSAGTNTNSSSGADLSQAKSMIASGNFQTAEKTLNQAAGGTSNDRELVDILPLQANVLEQSEKYSQAQETWQKLLTIQQKIGASQPDIARTKSQLAQPMLKQGDVDGAASLLNEAEKTLSEAPDKDKHGLAFVYYGLAKVALQREDFKKALDKLGKGITRLTNEGTDDPLLVNFLDYYGYVYLMQGRLDDAKASYEKMLKLAEEKIGKDSAEVGQGCQDFGMLYFKKDQLPKAETYLKKALAIKSNHFGADSVATAEPKAVLAMLYTKERKFNLAAPLFQSALDIRTREFGADSDEAKRTKKLYSTMQQLMNHH